METWKKIQKKNKRNEILGIVCMGVCLTIGIICDWNVLVKNNVLIQIEDITSFSIMAQLSRQKSEIFIMN